MEACQGIGKVGMKMCEAGTDKCTCPDCPETCQGHGDKRDYAADLAVYDKATPGPWGARAVMGTFSGPMQMPTPRGWEVHGFTEDDTLLIDWIDRKEDVDFIILARTALPWYIRRVMELEIQLQESKKNEKVYRDMLNDSQIKADQHKNELQIMTSCRDHWKTSFEDIKTQFSESQAEVERLREALDKLLNFISKSNLCPADHELCDLKCRGCWEKSLLKNAPSLSPSPAAEGA